MALCPACSGTNKGPECLCVHGTRCARELCQVMYSAQPFRSSPHVGCGSTSAPLLIRHRVSSLETCTVLHSVQWCNRRENLCCFHGNLCVGPWLEWGSRMPSVPAVSDFSKPHQRKASTPMLPQTSLVISIWGLWCVCYQKCSSRFPVITLLLHISTHAAALFWFSLLSTDSHCRALQDYPFKSCWGWHGQMQLVVGDWWPVKNDLGGSILSLAGRYQQPKWCQHQCLHLAALLKGHRD